MDQELEQIFIEVENKFKNMPDDPKLGAKVVFDALIKSYSLGKKAGVREVIEEIENVDLREFTQYEDGVEKEPESSIIDGVIFKLKQQLTDKVL